MAAERLLRLDARQLDELPVVVIRLQQPGLVLLGPHVHDRLPDVLHDLLEVGILRDLLEARGEIRE